MTSGQHGQADDVSRSDIEALGATRAELGKDYEEALLDSFADRVEQTIDRRVSSELARRNQGYGMVAPGGQPGYPTTGHPQPSNGNGAQLALGIVSTVALIPIVITLGVTGNWFALLIAVAAILGVNGAHAWHHKNQRPEDPRDHRRR